MPVSGSDRPGPTGVQLIAVGVDGHPPACDAALLATTIARATGSELMLVAIQPAVPPAVARQMGRTETETRELVQDLRGFMAPHARTVVETDRSVARGLARVVSRERAGLLVLGSCRHAPAGRARVGRSTRQLLGDGRCALAPRGLCSRGQQRLAVIGVGYDRTPEADAALSRAAALARGTGARLRVRAVADDRLPYAGWTPTGGPDPQEIWDQVIEPEIESLREGAERAVSGAQAQAVVEIKPGSPREELIALSREVDLLVIGSRRWGASARVLLGTTGEELMHQACCPVMVVPRSHAARRDAG